MRPSPGFRARALLRARLLRVLWTVLPRVPTRFRPSGSRFLDSLSEEVRQALHRDGLDPAPELLAGPRVRRVRLPMGVRGWLVTGYAEARAVLADATTFSNDFGHMVGHPGIGRELDPGGLGLTDPPYHTELRRLLAPEFTPRRLAQRLPRVEQIVADRLDALEEAADDRGRVDLVEQFARPVPWLVIADVLGLDDADRARLGGLGPSRFDLEGGVVRPLAVVTTWTEQLRELVARAREDPQPGLIGRLTSAVPDDAQLAGVVDGLVTGGLETTASMLALSALVLMQEPDTLEALRDPERPIRPQVDELLRRLTVVQVAFPRFARTDVQVGDTTLHRDDVVICSLSAANHDPGRPSSAHLAFGHGVHRCLGAELARMELETALPALVRRFPALTLATPARELAFHPHSAVFGVRELPVLLGGG